MKAWLGTARCRLTGQDYESFHRALQVLQQQGRAEAAETPGDGASAAAGQVLSSIAALLWRADFPEGPCEQFSWLSGFGETLPQVLQAAWDKHARESAPADVDLPSGCGIASKPELQEPEASRPAAPLSVFQRSEVFLARAEAEADEIGSTPPEQHQYPRRVRRRVSDSSSGVEVLSCPAANSSASAEDAKPAGCRPNLCTICHEPASRPEVAVLCGHFACQACWRRWLCEKLECPVCRCKVRRNNLVLLKGWGDG